MDEEKIRNIIADELLKAAPREPAVKRGFFAGGYLNNFRRKNPSRPLVTEEKVRSAVKSGAKTVRIPENSIITPLAREMIDEKGMRIVYEKSR